MGSAIEVRSRACRGRACGAGRTLRGTRLLTTAEMRPNEVRGCKLDEARNALIKIAARRLGLSARSFHRILWVVRTVAYCLAGREGIETAHLAETLRYQPGSQV